MAKISVITPIYIDIPDKLTWLSEMIESLISQSFQEWEAILIDDYSPLSLGDVKFRFQGEKRLRWFRTAEQFGPSKVRNSAVKLAVAEAILPLDSDDKLASEDVLQVLYEAWKQDKQSIIYGNLSRLIEQDGQWQTDRIFSLPSYTFERAMDLNGIMPVTALHSKACHEAAGGWKLFEGLEDVEYWIAAGERGFCGKKIEKTIFQYRRHSESRAYKLRHVNFKENDMKQAIIDRHKDIYEGNFPMGCCGGGKKNTIEQSLIQSPSNAAITALQGFPESDLVWVEYKGRKKASFSIFGRTIRKSYHIQGTGHKFQAHREDVQIFKGLERGQGFLVGIPDPRKQEEEKKESLVSPSSHPEPELATVERLDSVAISEGIIPDVGQSAPSIVEEIITIEESKGDSIESLGLTESLKATLDSEGWTIQGLAQAKEDDLLGYKGIGPARAKQIINEAKAWLGQM